MKKNLQLIRNGFIGCVLLACGMLIPKKADAQAIITVGNGNASNTTSIIPVNNLYNYTYSQQVYLASEIGVSGNITKLRFYFNAGTMLENDDWTVYLGYKTTNTFSGSTNWVPIGSLTQVFSGILPTPSSSGFTLEIPLTTPFYYDMSLGNLVVAIDENSSGYEYESTMFGVTPGTGRSIYYRSDVTNPDPSSPPSGTVYGYFPDIQFEIHSTTPCAAPITAGTITGAASVCPGVSTTISASGYTFAQGLSYQWQSSTNGFTWNDIAGATTPNLTTVNPVPTSYRFRVICPAGPDTVYSNILNMGVNPFMSCYCPNAAAYTGDGDISRVTVSNIDNYSAPTCQTYTDFTSTVAPGVLMAGMSYPITVIVDDCTPSYYYNTGAAVFIDFNQNGYFGDPGEKVLATNATTLNAPTPHTATFTVPLGALPGNTKMRVIAAEGYNGSDITSGCFSYNYGETEDYLINILPPAANEVSMVSIDSPELSNCTLGNTILATIKNNGTDTLTSVTFNVNTGGVLSTSVWNGNIPPFTAQQVTVPGSYFFNDGDTISLEVSLPNGVADAYSGDNFKGRRTHLALQGVYKVGYGVNNADSIADIPTVIQRIHQKGVCDTVYFDIKPGTYTGRYTINDYLGWAPGKQAIFRSETGNRSDVILVDSATSAATNYIFNLDGGDGIGFESLTLRARGATYRTIFNIKNGAHYFYVNDCDLLADTTTNGGAGTGNFDHLIIRSADGTKDDHSVITNNFFRGGGRAINLGSSTGTYEFGHVIKNNIIKNPYFIGVILNGVDAPVFDNNEITLAPYSTINPSYGTQLSQVINGGTAVGNSIKTYMNGYTLLISNVKGGTEPFLIGNNFLYSADSTTTAGSYGLYIIDANTNNLLVANNSIRNNSASANIGALTIADGSGIRLFNNNIGSYYNSPAVKVDKPYSIIESNNNNFWNEDGNAVGAFNGSPTQNLADWQNASGFDMNSVSVHPGFNGDDLHTCAPALESAGMPVASLSTDIDGDIRNSVPDIGADEFLGSAVGLLNEDEIEKCQNVSVSLGNPAISGVTYSWSSGENTSEINTSNAGQYIITATSACGSFSDTVTIINKPLPTAAFNIAAANGLSVVFNNTSTNATGYSWNFGDGETSTVENPTHMYSSAGQYVITLTVYGECDTVTTNNAVSVINVSNEEFESSNVVLYPNPATNFIVLESTNGLLDLTELELCDITGKVLRKVAVNDKTASFKIDVDGLNSGVYMLKYRQNESLVVLKFVKN